MNVQDWSPKMGSLQGNLKPYGSFGNGSAMKASAVGFAFNDIEPVMEVAKQSADESKRDSYSHTLVASGLKQMWDTEAKFNKLN